VNDKLKVPPFALSRVKLNIYGPFTNVVSKWLTSNNCFAKVKSVFGT
jgi:hypothetical protein